jgi:RimK family alpha-L-glutamate ligase
LLSFSDKTVKRLDEATQKGVVFTFGRFNPPTVGHGKLIKKVEDEARKRGFESRIYASTTEGNKKNPLKYDDKINYMRQGFKSSKKSIINDQSMKNPFFVAKKLSDEGVKDVVLVVGGDRVADLDREIRKYINHKDPRKSFNFDNFEVVSAGRRDPDADDVSGMSASKMRALAVADDFSGFLDGTPSDMPDRTASMMFDDIRRALNEEHYELWDSLPIDISEAEFLKAMNEETENKPVVLVLTKANGDEGSETAERIRDATKDKGFQFYLVDTDNAFVVDKDIHDDDMVIHNYDGNEKKITLETDDCIVIPRGAVTSTKSGSGLMSAFQQAGMFCINDLASIELCSNKYATAMMLEANKIPSPRTAMVNNESSIDIGLEKIGGKFPVVLKTVTGAEGIGVSIVDSYDSMKSVLQSMWKMGAEMIMQEHIDHDFDVRTIVLDGKVIASMKRVKDADGFRSNAALGNSTDGHKLTPEEEKIVLKAARKSKAFYCGVDHIIQDGKVSILEINTSPGSGQDTYTRKDNGEQMDGDELISMLLDYITDRDNWRVHPTEVGESEMIRIEGLGKVKCKTDSGNAGYNVMHAENIKMDEDKNEVTFTNYFGKKKTLPYYETKTVNIGSGVEENRPVVHLNITIGGKSHSDVPFTLADRSTNSHAVLLGKKFLIKVGYVINVAKDFVLSEQYVLSKLTSAARIGGDINTGTETNQS